MGLFFMAQEYEGRISEIAREINPNLWDQPSVTGSDSITTVHPVDPHGFYRKAFIKAATGRESFTPIRGVFINPSHPRWGRIMIVTYGKEATETKHKLFQSDEVQQIYFGHTNQSPFPKD